VTNGTIIRNGWTARLSNAPTANAVRVQVTGTGVGPARVLACVGAAKEVRLDVVGETADIMCDPEAGTITVKAVSAVAKIEVWKQTSPTTWTVAQLPTGAIYSTGSPATADPNNASPITVRVMQIDAAGAPVAVGSFELWPGASVDVTTLPGASRGSEQLHFHVLRGAVPFTLGSRTRTLRPGDVTVLPIEHGRQRLDQ
jgi:quercetin dioxygenase-like cupin family protein